MGNSSGSEAITACDYLNATEEEILYDLFFESTTATVKNDSKVDYEIASSLFCHVFNSKICPEFGSYLYEYISQSKTSKLKYSQFRETIVNCCKTTSVNSVKIVINTLLYAELESNSYVLLLLKLCVEFGLKSSTAVENFEDTILVLSNRLHRHLLKYLKKNSGHTEGDEISSVELLGWMNDYFPCISQLFLSYFNNICFSAHTFPTTSEAETVGEMETQKDAPGSNLSSNFKGFCPPILSNNALDAPNPSYSASHATSSILSEMQGEIFLLSLYSDMLQGNWSRLYSSDVHGMSFNRIAHHLLGYDGPTCILIKCAKRATKSNRDSDESAPRVIGMFSDSRWKDSNRYYGSANNFLFTLTPELNIYRTAGAGGCSSSIQGAQAGAHANVPTNYQYLNMKTYGYPHGLGMGGHLENFRFFIPDNMDEGTSDDNLVCIAGSSDLTYEPGEIVPPVPTTGIIDRYSRNSVPQGNFNIDCLEIWACGGESAISRGMEAQSKDRDVRNSNINKARQCDKAAFANSAFDQEFLLGNTFAHQSHAKDRDGST